MTSILTDADLLARLVSFDTTSVNSNLALIDFLCDYLDDPRITLRRIPQLDGQKANLMVTIPGLEKGLNDLTRQGLVLSGHTDVVPATEPDWQSDPFTLKETQDTYVARGACDMKGFVALVVNLARWAVDENLAHPLVLILTYDEEVGSFGAIEVVKSWDDSWPLPKAAIIGEPTSLRLVRMHKGHLKMRITCQGRGAHSGYPHLGVNAIEPAARIVQALSALRVQLEGERVETSSFFPETPYVALNVAQIHGGTAINVIPELCTVDIGLRPLPGMDSEKIITRVEQTITQVEDHEECRGRGECRVEVLHNNPPMLLSEESQSYQRFKTLLSQEDSLGVSYATDAGILQNLDLDCVIWGPGTIEVAHKPNESIPKTEFLQARQRLEKIVTTFCQ